MAPFRKLNFEVCSPSLAKSGLIDASRREIPGGDFYFSIRPNLAKIIAS